MNVCDVSASQLMELKTSVQLSYCCSLMVSDVHAASVGMPTIKHKLLVAAVVYSSLLGPPLVGLAQYVGGTAAKTYRW